MQNPLRKEQHAYQEEKSAETALVKVMAIVIEKGIRSGFPLTVLLDIEGAFNHTLMEQRARENKVPDTVETWMRCLLVSRRVVAEWKQPRREVWFGKGCPQGGGSVPHTVASGG